MSIEDQLHASLADDRRALPAWPDATGRVRRGMRRRRRRRAAAVALGVAIALAVPVTVTAFVSGSAVVPIPGGSTPPTGTAAPSGQPAPSGSLDESAVPWVDQPATYTPGPPTTPPTARPCTAADLSATAAVADRRLGISEEDAADVIVKNISASRCTLSGIPGLVTKVSGRYRSVPAGQGLGVPAPAVSPASINPQDDAHVQLAKTLVCNGGTGPTEYAEQLALTVDGHTVPIPGLKLSGTCPGVHVSPWYTLQPDPVSAFAQLSGHIVAPPSAVRGQPLRYAVDLTNNSDTAVPLDPCPVYRETIYKLEHTYRLNCAPGSIGPGRTVRFSMVIDLPADLPVGAMGLTWQIIDFDYEAADDVQILVTG